MTRIVTIPGTRGIILPGAPKIVMSDFERTIANLPGLMFVIDPAALSANGSGRDRFSQSLLTPRGTQNVRITSHPAFNGLPALDVQYAYGGLALTSGSVSKSYTLIFVGQEDGVSWDEAGTRQVFTAFRNDGTAYHADMRFNNAHALTFVRDGEINSGSASYGIRREEVGVWAASYDDDAKESVIFSNYGDYTKRLTHTHEVAVSPDDFWVYGGGYSLAGWQGKLGIGIICDRALHRSTYLPHLRKVISALKNQYGIA